MKYKNLSNKRKKSQFLKEISRLSKLRLNDVVTTTFVEKM